MTTEEIRRRARVAIAAEQRAQEAPDDLQRWEAEFVDHTQDFGGAM